MRKRVNATIALCVRCGKRTHITRIGVKRVTPKILWNFACRKCEGNISEAVEQEGKLSEVK